MRSYWIWLLFLIVAWLLAIAHFGVSLSDMPLRMIGSACFFALFFLSPLLRQQNGWHFLLFISLAALAVAALWPRPEMMPNPYILLVFSIVAGKAVYRLHPVQAGITGAILAAGAVIPYLVGLPAMPIAFLLLCTAAGRWIYSIPADLESLRRNG
ncbi:hypothetical protein [Planococcus salinus]|uniref:Uncharacterized protein n=1 Tax=Planococcus salinus TaxID=1848460 RepID=A0A3M8P8P2_9BACL|nr:hypothetical protein [Planococcus salinus]RNF39564.1 hypothetical protein EEX84_08805 [Planococcus salinus]